MGESCHLWAIMFGQQPIARLCWPWRR